MSAETRRGSVGAAVASLFIPGLGQAICGHGRRGAIWALAVFLAWAVPSLIAGFWLGALGLGLGLSVIVWIACAIDAWRQPKEDATLRGFLPLVIVVVFSMSIGQVGVALVIRTTALEAFKIPSGSACPTLEVGDHVFVDKTAYRVEPIRVGDVIVHRATVASGQEVDFVRRVVAVGGDDLTVDENGHVTVRGRAAELRPLGRVACGSAALFEERFDGERDRHWVAFEADHLGFATGPVRVPEGELYLVGDNRMNSHDSRMTGTVKVADVKGRVWRIWLRGTSVTWLPVR